MKILLYTDNHFCSYSSIIRERGERFSKRLENQIQSLNWVERLSKEQNCDLEICLGDFFDKETLNSEEISALKEIEWNDTQKHFIVGNHEMGSSDLVYNSMNILSSIGKVHNKPYALRYDEFGVDFIIIPYILESNRKSLKEHIKEAYSNVGLSFETNNYKIVFTHNDISGVKYGKFESKVGFPLNEINEECMLFIDGHIHNQTTFGDKCIVLGNLTGLNFSEDATKYKHSAYVLDTVGLKIMEHENPYAFNFYKFEYYDISQIASLKGNSIVSMKVPQNSVSDVKEFLSDNNDILKFRITVIPENTNNKEFVREQIVSKDHITQFQEYILEALGESDIIKQELLNLLR